MTQQRQRSFDYRAFWSLLLAVSGIGLPWSGVELHVAGHGGWTRATHGWMAVHWVFVLLFLVGVAGHLVLNRRALVRYFRGAVPRGLPFSREALTALAITAGLVLLAIGHVRR
jgi:hypothetical protein